LKTYIYPYFTLICFCLNTAPIHADNNLKSPQEDQNIQAVVAQNPKFEIDGEFLYWKVKQNGNEFAQTGQAISTPGINGVSSINPGKIYAPKYSMQPGFKIACDFKGFYDNWDAKLNYMWIQSYGSKSIKSLDTNSGIIPIFSVASQNSALSQATYNGGIVSFVSGAKATSQLYLNAVDLELGKTWIQTDKLKLRSFIGLKGAWMHQSLRLTYDTSSVFIPTSQIGSNFTKHTEYFQGLGIKLGANTSWMFAKYFGIFMDFATSLLWGNSKTLTKNFDSQAGAYNYSNTLLAQQINNYHPILPVFEAFLGLGYDKTFKGNIKSFKALVGWEEQIWLFQNRHSTVVADNSLIMQGLTVKIGFGF
jgi:hypothetical protein